LSIGLTRRDRLRFLRTYFLPLRQVLRDEARLLAHMEREANRLQERYLRKYAKGTEFVEGALSLAEAWKPLSSSPAGNDAALAVLSPAFHALGRLHAAGLVQADLHLGNFLQARRGYPCHRWRRGSFNHTGETVGRAAGLCESCCPAGTIADGVGCVPARHCSLPMSSGGGVAALTDPATLDEALSRVRAWRLRDFLGKTLRDCTCSRLPAVPGVSPRATTQLRRIFWRRSWRARRRDARGAVCSRTGVPAPSHAWRWAKGASW
jgi:hypothetical protein